MVLNLNIPESPTLTPTITVFGVGGAGGNAVNNMISSNLAGANFVVANTDSQALEHSKAPIRLQLGEHITKGLGAGASPEVGAAAADESAVLIENLLEGSNMLFITAGMGGGTGTGAAPVVARIARSKGILTVGVVTKPFNFEGAHRMKLAEAGLQELQKHVDTLIVIPNQNLFRVANERTTFADAFKMADDVLHAGVRGVTDLITMPGLINLDFADIVTIMNKMGKAMMGTGEASGENRAIVAAEAAISNPLLDHSSMKGARGVLINITGGLDMTLFEVDEAANRIREEVDSDANIIFGSTFNPSIEGKIRITVVATGIDIPKDQLSNVKLISKNLINSNDNCNEEKNLLTEDNIAINLTALEAKNEIDNAVSQSSAANIFNEQNDDFQDLENELISQHELEHIPHPKKTSIKEDNKDSKIFTTSNANKNFHATQEMNTEASITTKSSNNSNNVHNNQQSKQGLLSRMANSLGFGSTNATIPESKKEKKQQNFEFDENVDENVDIPAFLRRKTK